MFTSRNPGFICSISCQGIRNLERLNRHTKSSSPIYYTHCGKTYCFESQLRQHLATSHLDGGVPAPPADLNKAIVGQTPCQKLAEYEDILDEYRGTIKSYEVNKTL